MQVSCTSFLIEVCWAAESEYRLKINFANRIFMLDYPSFRKSNIQNISTESKTALAKDSSLRKHARRYLRTESDSHTAKRQRESTANINQRRIRRKYFVSMNRVIFWCAISSSILLFLDSFWSRVGRLVSVRSHTVDFECVFKCSAQKCSESEDEIYIIGFSEWISALWQNLSWILDTGRKSSSEKLN